MEYHLRRNVTKTKRNLNKKLYNVITYFCPVTSTKLNWLWSLWTKQFQYLLFKVRLNWKTPRNRHSNEPCAKFRYKTRKNCLTLMNLLLILYLSKQMLKYRTLTDEMLQRMTLQSYRFDGIQDIDINIKCHYRTKMFCLVERYHYVSSGLLVLVRNKR